MNTPHPTPHAPRPWLLTLLAPAAMLALTSCSSTPPIGEKTSSTTYQEGVPGRVVVDTYKLNATVTGIDDANRKVTLVSRDGKQTTVKCGPEIINFDQIHVGDQVKVTATAELAVAMADASAPSRDGGAAVVALTPVGAKPGGLMARRGNTPPRSLPSASSGMRPASCSRMEPPESSPSAKTWT